MNTRRVVVALLGAWLTSLAVPASAVPFTFTRVTTDSAENGATGEAQISVDVTESASGVLFTFTNTGPNPSSITDVYFENGPLDVLSSVVNGTGVLFAPHASPGDLPGGTDLTPIFDVSPNSSADSDPSVVPNGVNPGETLGIEYTLDAGASLQDVLDGLGNGTLRVGAFVQGFADGGSEAFITSAGAAPEPATLALLGSALACAALLRARRS
jgi:hypothetical protein